MKGEVLLMNGIILHGLSALNGVLGAGRASIIPYKGSVLFSCSGWISHVCFGALPEDRSHVSVPAHLHLLSLYLSTV